MKPGTYEGSLTRITPLYRVPAMSPRAPRGQKPKQVRVLSDLPTPSSVTPSSVDPDVLAPPTNAATRARGLAQQVRRLAGEDGARLVSLYWEAATRGTLPFGEDGDARPIRPADQLAALEWLANRGFGKVPTEVDLNVDPTGGVARDLLQRRLDRMPAESRADLARLARQVVLASGTDGDGAENTHSRDHDGDPSEAGGE